MRKMRSKIPPPAKPSDRVLSEFAVEVAPAPDLLQGKIGLGNSAGSGAYLIIVKRGMGFFYRERVREVCLQAFRAYSRFCSKVFPFISYARLDLD